MRHAITRLALPATFAAALLAAALAGPDANAQSADSDARARQLLKASTSFLASRERFTVDTRSTIEVVFTNGEKIQFDHAAKLMLQRPDRLRAERRGDLVEQVFHYDGTSLTLGNPVQGYYATVPAPATVEGMLDFARDTLDLVVPAGDLLYRDAYDILMKDVTSGRVVGKSVVEGVRCDHLAFRADHADWQIWIEEGPRPLPRRLVITSRDVPQAPQFEVRMVRWDLAPKFSAGTFTFVPPRNARRVEFLPVGPPVAGSR